MRSSRIATGRYENACCFDDWANDLGYDADSRAVKRTYDQCGRIAKKVRVLLGDAFEWVASAEH